MKKVYIVLCCNKNQRVGLVSSDGYDSLEKAQAFCEGRYNTRKINAMYYASESHDYFINEIIVK